MMTPEAVEALIRAGVPCEHLQVAGDGHHFEALIVSAEFAGKNRVARQQRVLQVLGSRIETNELHALSMRTLTPEEWAAERARG